MKRFLLVIAGALALAAEAANPISEETALSLSIPAKATGVDVTLYQDGTNFEGVCYYKMTLTRSKKCTLWLEEETGGAIEIVSAYAKDNWDMDIAEPGAIFMTSVYGHQTRWVFTGEGWSSDWSMGSGDDDWDDWGWDDPVVPSSWTYYLVIRGDLGATAKLHAESGVKVPVGTVANPLSITMKTNVQTNSCTFVEDQYTVSAKLEAGRRYYVGVTGGSEEHELQFIDLPNLAIANYLPWDSEHNDSRVFVTEEGQTCVFAITSSPEGQKSARLFYRVDATRALKDHIKSIDALAAGDSRVCEPGYKNNPRYGAYDEIIDDTLFSFKADKNSNYLFETTGATVPLEMIVYDSKGKVVASNKSKGGGSVDVRCTLETTAAGTYYVGVCESMSPVEEYEPSYAKVTLKVRKVDAVGKDVQLAQRFTPVWGQVGVSPLKSDRVAGPNALDDEVWYQMYAFEGRKDMSYSFAFAQAEELAEGTALGFEVFTLSGKTEKKVAEFSVSPNSGKEHTLNSVQNATYYVRVSVAGSVGCDYAPFDLHVTGYPTDGGHAGWLKVAAQGTDAATWSLGSESVKYASGETLLVPAGNYVVKYAAVKGFSTPASRSVLVLADTAVTVEDGYYSDTSDHKDDVASGATTWALKNTLTSFSRTLWSDDPADYFAIAGKDGYLYDFRLTEADGDAVFSVYSGDTKVVGPVTEVSQLALPTSKQKYYLVVEHGTAAKLDGKYTLSGLYANVGSVKFAKNAVSAKDTATSVTLTVNRTAKDGAIKVSYVTVAGTAQAGEQFEPQAGVLEWANGDSKAKTIVVKLIPKLIAAYNGGNHDFSVQLADAGGEYPVQFSGSPTAVVTITETSKPAVTVESVYAKKAPKAATVKTEQVGLETGTFYGLVDCGAEAVTNGLAQLGAVTFTCSSAAAPVLSAKVALAGKTYSFTSKVKAWDDYDAALDEYTKTFVLSQKVNKVTYENRLTVVVAGGETATSGDWLDGRARVTLTMNVPDANGKGVQPNVVYTGTLYRQNAKVQEYLTAITNFVGYYTVALANPNLDAYAAPAGNGYLTLTVDNKGTAKVAGMLPDGTKVSLSVTASALLRREGGYELVLPLLQVKSPMCFGGELYLYARPIDRAKSDGKYVNPDGKAFDVVVDTAKSGLVWNNDNVKLTYEGLSGWQLVLAPVGGWYDTVFNLQNYYRSYAYEVSTAELSEFPKELLKSGYSFVTTGQEADGYPVEILDNGFSTPKRTLVKSGKLNDFEKSVNPCNVQVSLARATGVVTGSFSLWSVDAAGAKQQEVTGAKHNGILLLQREPNLLLPDSVLSAGFFSQSVKVQRAVDRTARSWTFSQVFNLVEEDL